MRVQCVYADNRWFLISILAFESVTQTFEMYIFGQKSIVDIKHNNQNKVLYSFGDLLMSRCLQLCVPTYIK